MYKFISPLKISVPRKTKEDKVYYLNLNGYRNWNFIVSNNLKKDYSNLMKPQLPKIIKLNRVEIIYTFYKRDNRHIDMNNVIAVIDKFFQDFIVDAGIIEDDTTEYVVKTTNIFGGLDPDKTGKVIIEVKEYNEKN